MENKAAGQEVREEMRSLVTAHEVISKLSGMAGDTPNATETLRSILADLRNMKLPSFPTTRLCLELEEQLSHNNDLTAFYCTTVVQHCQEMRFHLAASYLAYQAMVSPQPAVSLDNFTIGQVADNPCYSKHGVSYALIRNLLVIVLPVLVDPKLWPSVLADLLELQDCRGQCYKWLIDFSAVNQLPTLSLATILGLRQTLLNQGQDLYCIWVASDLLSPQGMLKLIRLLDLEERVGHWFSRAVVM